MASIFDINQPALLCQICGELHPKTNPCKYDVLVKRIHSLTHGIHSLQAANKEAVDLARTFQKIIRDMTPQTERLLAIENEYNDLVFGLKNAVVYPFAPGKSPAEATPLVGVSVDAINDLIPPEPTHNVEAFMSWLKSKNKLLKEDHACSTGDCPHQKQSECDETLAKEYPTQGGNT